MLSLRLHLFLLSLAFSLVARGERSPLAFYDARIVFAPISDGYISSIDEDTITPMKELILMRAPVELNTSVGTETFFTDPLRREFKERYREKFGFTEAQQFLNDPVEVNFYGAARGYSQEDENHRATRRLFGEYVVKRTTEYHVDNYFKSEPKLKKIYELKEKISHIDLRVNETTKFDINYSFAGNYLTGSMESPIVHSRLQFEMVGTTPGAISETIFGVSRSLSPTVSGETYYKFNNQTFAVVARKRLAENIESSITFQGSGPNQHRSYEHLYFAGISLLN